MKIKHIQIRLKTNTCCRQSLLATFDFFLFFISELKKTTSNLFDNIIQEIPQGIYRKILIKTDFK